MTTPAVHTTQNISGLEELCRAGTFVVTAELGPPKSADDQYVRQKAQRLKGAADAYNITDNQLGVVRMSSLAMAHLLVEEGLEPVMQITCRDRNRLALQSDLMGAWALGVRNILCLTGDHPKFGNHPEAKTVYDLRVGDLIALARRFREEGTFLNGEPLKSRRDDPIVAPKFFIGVAANASTSRPEAAVKYLEEKILAGGQFVQTQPVFDLDRFTQWMELVRAKGLHQRVRIFAGAMPVKSAAMLRYMQEHVPGSNIPPSLIERLDRAADPQAEGLAICQETVSQLRRIPGVGGVHLMTVGWESAIRKVVETAGLLP
ncbi:MAG: methylenetetrahydrofolate reductase, partial [Elusimicrobia bacterium]|nr:methylenetetrahydrofolate reductase [Elusimicrobiota bacterium]